MGYKFDATFDSLKKYVVPEWFRDVKFGIWSHWGPQSVPMCGDWYARNMYIQGTDQYNYHVRNYGHPSKFGYLDICKLWKAERFDPDELMDLYYKAGARYFVAQAMHHDNFFNYDSKVNRYNSVNMGPGKDICRLWKEAADRYNMYFGLTEHHGASFSWWQTNKGKDSYGPYKDIPYDGNNPDHADFYYKNHQHILPNGKLDQWLTGNKEFQSYWLNTIKELVDMFQPDLLYSDSGLPFEEEGYQLGLEAVSYLYNASIDLRGNNQAVYTQKSRREDVYSVGVLDIEKSQLDDIQFRPWQTDTCIGNWFYDSKQKYKKPDQIIEMLVDIISKNGTMLLNVLQRPDGTIDEEARFILNELSAWFNICGKAVHGTRPYQRFGEGDTMVAIEGFREDKTEWNSSDYRFTTNNDHLYAFIMKPADNRVAVIKSLTPKEKVLSVSLLGHGSVDYVQSYGILTVKLPEKMPTAYTNCLEIEISH